MYQLIERRLYDIAGVTDKSINVYYNGKLIKQKHLINILVLYLGNDKVVYEEIIHKIYLGHYRCIFIYQ